MKLNSSIWRTVFDIEKKKQELKNLEKETQGQDFWQNGKEALKIQQKYTELKAQLEFFSRAEKELRDLKEFLTLVKEGSKEEQELAAKIKSLGAEIKQQTQKIFLSGEYDTRSAIISIQAGAGGRDAEDWVALLLRMYQRYCQRNKWNYKILTQRFTEGGGPEGRLGIKDVSMLLKGEMAYGLLKEEAGVHRLVRLSPFSAKKLRHTSFAKVEVLPEIAEVDEEALQVKPDDLKIDTFKASGHGGQNVNKRQTAVRITHLPTGLTASAQSERQQAQNRKLAMKILLAKLMLKQQQEKEQELSQLRSQRVPVDFGHQIRSYVFHPYKLIKDHRTGLETSDIEEVLDGNLDRFIEAEIRLL